MEEWALILISHSAHKSEPSMTATGVMPHHSVGGGGGRRAVSSIEELLEGNSYSFMVWSQMCRSGSDMKFNSVATGKMDMDVGWVLGRGDSSRGERWHQGVENELLKASREQGDTHFGTTSRLCFIFMTSISSVVCMCGYG